MKRQMTATPAPEMQSGMKMKDLARDSRLTRSTRPGEGETDEECSGRRQDEPDRVVAQCDLEGRIGERLNVVVERPFAFGNLGEALDDRPHRRRQQEDGEHDDRRSDEHVGADDCRGAGGQQLYQGVGHHEQRPDADDAEDNADQGLHQLAAKGSQGVERGLGAEDPQPEPDEDDDADRDREIANDRQRWSAVRL